MELGGGEVSAQGYEGSTCFNSFHLSLLLAVFSRPLAPELWGAVTYPPLRINSLRPSCWPGTWLSLICWVNCYLSIDFQLPELVRCMSFCSFSLESTLKKNKKHPVLVLWWHFRCAPSQLCHPGSFCPVANLLILGNGFGERLSPNTELRKFYQLPSWISVLAPHVFLYTSVKHLCCVPFCSSFTLCHTHQAMRHCSCHLHCCITALCHIVQLVKKKIIIIFLWD